MQIIIGLFFIALGMWGVFDEWLYVVDFLKGGGSVFLILAGILAVFAGVAGPLEEATAADEDDDNVEPADELFYPLDDLEDFPGDDADADCAEHEQIADELDTGDEGTEDD